MIMGSGGDAMAPEHAGRILCLLYAWSVWTHLIPTLVCSYTMDHSEGAGEVGTHRDC